jgi:hypothetical protein
MHRGRSRATLVSLVVVAGVPSATPVAATTLPTNTTYTATFELCGKN